MSGEYSGLQARIPKKFPTAFYSPCCAHSLNLVGGHSTSCCKESREFFMSVNNIYMFFSGSTRRWKILANFLTKKTNLTLKTLSNTRRSARDEACRASNEDWYEITQALKYISDDVQRSARDEACRASNEDWYEITQALKYISDDVHEKGTSRSETACYLRQLQKLERDLLSRFNIIQSLTDKFDIYENGALVKSEVDLYEDEMKRKKKRKLHAAEGRQGEVELLGRDNFRVNTFKVILDKLQSEMIKRKTVYDDLFRVNTFKVILDKLQSEMIKRKTVYDDLSSLFGFLVKKDTNLGKLKDDSKKLCTFYNLEVPEQPKNILQVYEILQDNELQDVYPYVDIALKLFLTIPEERMEYFRKWWGRRVGRQAFGARRRLRHKFAAD
ncbi:hypothetical protein QE152_g27151 [Popillia japonica]|uniref:Transposase n=1 Tax=Popillia japonica TaxID=7064 RepID=A0AAW1JVF1_POPJA